MIFQGRPLVCSQLLYFAHLGIMGGGIGLLIEDQYPVSEATDLIWLLEELTNIQLWGKES